MVVDFYSIVEIKHSSQAVAHGVAGKRGVIRGISSGESGVSYAVAIDGELQMVEEGDIIDTGLKSDPAEHYSGETIVVAPQDYRDEGTPR
jgi:hypothetical protein